MRGQPVLFDDFRGGVNLPAAPYSLDLNQARDVLNVNASSIGGVQKRNGFNAISTPTLPLTSLFGYNSSTDYLVGLGDNGTTTDLYRYTAAGVQASIKGSLALSAGSRAEFVQAPASGGQGPVWGVNGTNTPFQWTGSGNAVVWTASTGTLPQGKFILYVGNRVLIAGDPANPSKLYASGLGDPRDWATPSAVTTTFDPDDGETITGLGTVGPYVLVFKASKVYVVFDLNTLGYRRVSGESGSIAPRSIVETPSGTFYLSPDQGVMVTDGQSVTPVGIAVQPLFDKASVNVVNAAGIYFNYKYYLSFDSALSVNDYLIEYDTKVDSWWIHKIQLTSDTTDGINQWAILNPETNPTLYAAGSSTVTKSLYEAFKDNLFTDNGLDYFAYWTTQWHTFQLPHLRKIIRQLRCDGIGSLTMEHAKSFGTVYANDPDLIWEQADGVAATTFGGTGTFGGSGIFGDQVLPQEHRFYTLGTGRAWSFRFSSTSSGEWQLYSYMLAIDSRRD